MKKAAILLLLLVSLSFAGELWKIDTGSAIREQPLQSGIRIIVGTAGGKVYSMEPPAVKWSYNVGSPIVSEPAILGDNIIVATETKIVALNQYGAFQWEAPLPGITSFGVSDKIYVADQNGIQALNSNGTLAWNFVPGSEEQGAATPGGAARPVSTDISATRPLATASQVFFGNRDYIYAVSTSGKFQWKKQTGHLWSTPPSFDAGTLTLYFGTAEGLLYAVDPQTGRTRFTQNVYGQISTTPLLFEGNVIVGTSDNNVYSVSPLGVQWSAQVDGKVSSKMSYVINPSGTSVLYLTTTKSIYAIDPRNGEILFKKPFLDWPSSPNYINGQVVVGSAEGKLYGLDPNRGCSLLYPQQDAEIGDYAISLYGISYSAAGQPLTGLRVNGGQWIQLNDTIWEYNFDPSQYPYGVLDLECRVSDAWGAEVEPYTKSTLIHVQAAEPLLMTITYPDAVKANTNFTISIFDPRGLPLAGAKVKTTGKKTFTSRENGNVTMSLPEGAQVITIEKPGYKSEKATINSKADPTLAYVTGFLFIIGLLAYVYFFFLKREKKEMIVRERH